MADDNRDWAEGSKTNTGSMSSDNQDATKNLSSEDRSKGGKATHEQGTAQDVQSEDIKDTGDI